MQQAQAAAAAVAVGNQGSIAHAGPSGINATSGVTQGQPGSAGPYPPFSVQRRAQLAQQGLGGMGGMRPPGKTGLSFDVILSRLQGELQKSKQTGHELDSLTGAMHVIQDTLGGSLVSLFFIPFPPVILTSIRLLAWSSSSLSFKSASCAATSGSIPTTRCCY